jgi:hypothetical protein
LEVTEVGLEALAKQEKGFLSGQVGEACKGRQLCVNLALQEGGASGRRADAGAQDLETVASDVGELDLVGLARVEGETKGVGIEERGS